jgi:hypothetical protein
VIEFQAHEPDKTGEAIVSEATHMLAEKFILLLEAAISRIHPDGSRRASHRVLRTELQNLFVIGRGFQPAGSTLAGF